MGFLLGVQAIPPELWEEYLEMRRDYQESVARVLSLACSYRIDMAQAPQVVAILRAFCELVAA